MVDGWKNMDGYMDKAVQAGQTSGTQHMYLQPTVVAGKWAMAERRSIF